MVQKIITSKNEYLEMDNWIEEAHIRRILLVCGSSLDFHKELVQHLAYLEERGIVITKFSDYASNPTYESVVKGVNAFKRSQSDSLIAVGGGSAMDVAKCIKLFINMDHSINYLVQDVIPSGIPFLAIPTTAGTGSEATRYAVIYYNGVKQSVSDYSCIPEVVLMDSSLLKTLPLYQKKATMMDAFSHALESFWSVNSTDESKKYSIDAIKTIIDNMEGYLNNTALGNERMLIAANLAGRAINITQTTAGHAMCYKLTSIFGLSHGHAAIICNKALYRWMIDNTSRCIDIRGEEYLRETLDDIAIAMGEKNALLGANKLCEIVNKLELNNPKATNDQYFLLKHSVNVERLRNFPIELDSATIDLIYHMILE